MDSIVWILANRKSENMKQFHPTISKWFAAEFGEPTEIQKISWPEIKKGRNTLIAAPTGSGKTLAAFLSAIDDLFRKSIKGKLPDCVHVIYVSPLKALSNDIHKNLQNPLRGICDLAEADEKLQDVKRNNIRVAVRTGDTTQSERAAMLRKPPHILVTTPESLYLLLTSEKGRTMLSTVSTVIVDEIHAIIGSKRGSHLSISLERLEYLSGKPLTRVGLSATQSPIEQVAEFLCGNSKDPCAILDTGHRRKMDLGVVIPSSPLSAVMSNEVWSELHKKLETLILQHTTTLIFVNTRRLAERLAHTLTGILGKDVVTAHHGSLSKEQRLDAEQRLKNGELRALVATASLELGIDIGAVDLVCQISSPRSISAFLQRVGRSGHSIHGLPRGRLFPLSLDDLVECSALLAACCRGELDKIVMPEKPLDILAQHIVAEASCQDWKAEELYQLVIKTYPYRDLKRQEFDSVVRMLSEGYSARRGRKGAYIHFDAVHGMIRPRKAARLAALLNGGAIPDNFSYDVVLEPSGTYIGNVHEDFAIESIAGDIFQLGNSSWRVLGVQTGKVRVEDAAGLPPTIPFWLGEAPGRTAELSTAVSDLREYVEELLVRHELQRITIDIPGVGNDELQSHTAKGSGPVPGYETIATLIADYASVSTEVANQLVNYLASAWLSLRVMPTQKTVVIERFFDETGDMHMVIHSIFGSEVNRAWGLALRKKFCRSFNFELQAAANDNALILSLGPTHSFQLETVFHYLQPETVRNTLIQALLDAPMFEVRWRWNANCSLAVLKTKAGKRVAPQLQRMDAEDLLAVTFPDQLACLENIVGDREIPDHPLVNQTIHDCLTEAMDIERLESLLRDMAANHIKCIALDLTEASPLAQEILNANPYAFLDPAPLEERRTQAVRNRRWLDPSDARDLGRLDPGAITKVQEEARPSPRNSEELHDALLLHAYFTDSEAKESGSDRDHMFEELKSTGRATVLCHDRGKTGLWVATERVPQFLAVYDKVAMEPEVVIPQSLQKEWQQTEALKEMIRGRMEFLGPVTITELCSETNLPRETIHFALAGLENEGFVFQGNYSGGKGEIEWCERRLLARINQLTLTQLRQEISAVPLQDYARFLFAWQHLTPSEKANGPQALEAIVRQLEGFEAPAASWESEILPLRIAEYDPVWLDVLCMSGKFTWGRFRLPAISPEQGSNPVPVKATPVSLVTRKNLALWHINQSRMEDCISRLRPESGKILNEISKRGASFFDDLVRNTGLLNSQVENALTELVARGLVNSDSFTGLRAILTPLNLRPRLHENGSATRGRRAVFGMDQSGRWSLLASAEPMPDQFELAWVLLRRYGIIFRGIVSREPNIPPWRDLVRLFRKLEIRGEVRGGRFVEGVYGEQFALPDALGLLRRIRKEPKEGMTIAISSVDPANLMGSVMPGEKVPYHSRNKVLFRDGLPVAKLVSGEITFLEDFDPEEKWRLRNELLRKIMPEKLRAYLGKRGIRSKASE